MLSVGVASLYLLPKKALDSLICYEAIYSRMSIEALKTKWGVGWHTLLSCVCRWLTLGEGRMETSEDSYWLCILDPNSVQSLHVSHCIWSTLFNPQAKETLRFKVLASSHQLADMWRSHSMSWFYLTADHKVALKRNKWVWKSELFCVVTWSLLKSTVPFQE